MPLLRILLSCMECVDLLKAEINTDFIKRIVEKKEVWHGTNMIGSFPGKIM